MQSASGSLTGATIATSDGTITLKGSVKTQTSATKTAYSFSFSDFITDTTTMTDHACIIYNSAKGTLSYDADGTGSIEAVQFATLVGKVTFTAADITLI